MMCWWCGVEPDDVIDVLTMESATPISYVVRWPGGDHEHAERPPTPDEIAQQAYRMLNERVS